MTADGAAERMIGAVAHEVPNLDALDALFVQTAWSFTSE